MSAHTPGPWHVLGGRGGYMIQTTRPGPRIVRGAGGIPNEADARLVAAAPELLQALEWLTFSLNWTDSYCELCAKHAPKNEQGEITGSIVHDFDCCRWATEAAIRKARGRS